MIEVHAGANAGCPRPRRDAARREPAAIFNEGAKLVAHSALSGASVHDLSSSSYRFAFWSACLSSKFAS